MFKSLSDEDSRAVDLLLDRGDSDSTGVFVPPGQISPGRVQSVENILSVLAQLPASDPPKDLAAKTLRRIDEAIAAMRPANVPAHLHAGDNSRPSA